MVELAMQWLKASASVSHKYFGEKEVQYLYRSARRYVQSAKTEYSTVCSAKKRYSTPIVPRVDTYSQPKTGTVSTPRLFQKDTLLVQVGNATS